MVENVPVYVIAFNNPTYVTMMVRQLLDKKMTTRVVVVDNASSTPRMLSLLDELSAEPGVEIVRMAVNYGCDVVRNNIHDKPSEYVITDPDLLFHPDMPSDAISVLRAISVQFEAPKVGLALDVTNAVDEFRREHGYNIYQAEWERQFWVHKLPHVNPTWPDIFRADIGHTFAFHNKAYPEINAYQALRVAGCFTCKHLPWYSLERWPSGAPQPSEEETLEYQALQNGCSTISNFLTK